MSVLFHHDARRRGALALAGALWSFALALGVWAWAAEAARNAAPDVSALATSITDKWEAELPGGTAGTHLREVPVGGALVGGKLRLAVRLGAPAPRPVWASVYLVNKQGLFYKSARNYLVTNVRKTEIELDLAPGSADLVPTASAARPWSGCADVPVARVGVGLYSADKWSGPVEVSDVRVDERPAASAAGQARLDGLSISSSRPAAGSMVEVSFVLAEEFANPFDPACAELDALLVAAPGTGGRVAQQVPAYFDQDYLTVTEGFGARSVPVGPPRWKVRLAPPAQGEYVIRLRRAGATLAELPLSVGPEPERRPRALPGREELERLASDGDEIFIRRLPADPGRAAAVLQNGRFQPVAPNSGIVLAWVAPLEWTSRWGAWMGAGRYNLEVASRLDAALARAAARGVKLPLMLNFDGPFSQGDKYRWEFNPWSVAQGGPVAAPSQYYRDKAALEGAASLFRYLAARYANHPAVDGLVLGATLPADGVEDWHAQVAASLSKAFGGGTGLRVSSFHPLAVRMLKEKKLGTFEPGDPKGWSFDRDVCPETKAGYSTDTASQGKQSLRVEAELPGEICLVRSFSEDIMNAGDYDLLAFDVYLPKGAPEHLRAMIYLRDREMCWFEQLLAGEARAGDWTRFVIDLRPGRSALAAPLGKDGKPLHAGAWDGYSRQRLRVIGLRLFAAKDFNAAYKGPVYLDNVRLLGEPELREEEPKLAILDLKGPETRTPELYGKVEYTFRLNRTFSNPFDPECVEVRARVLAADAPPERQLRTVPGFFYQEYRRSSEKEVTVLLERTDPAGKATTIREKVATPEGAERLDPDGPGVWKVRLAPTDPGAHTVTIEVLVPDPGNKGKMIVAAARKDLTFDAVAGTTPGFIRAAGDQRHFEHTSGEFFYPIGMAIRSPSDARDLGRDKAIREHILGSSPVELWSERGHSEKADLLELRGTYQFDDYFKRCGESGMNWARVWMAPWWLGLEWDHRYPGYEGAGRYNLANAWRLDHVLNEAEKNGIYLQLCLSNHGQTTTRIDRQWDFNPYNALMPVRKLYNAPDHPAYDVEASPYYEARPGGFAANPREWFTSEKARKLFKQRLRYIVARWGYSPKVMAWGLMSEVEFTGGTDFRAEGNWDRGEFPLQTEWHREMGRYLRAIDPYRHMVTSHFSHPCNGTDLWQLPEMDCVHSNAYSSFPWLGGSNNEGGISGAPHATEAYYSRFMGRYNKPVLVGEWGGFHMKNPVNILDSELHAGLWAEAMVPLGGATGFWWWLHVHYNNRYGEFAALSRFMKGEDLRGVTTQLHGNASMPAGGAGGQLDVLAVGDGQKRAYAWVYAKRIAWGEADNASFENARLSLDGLNAGTYDVEFWNPGKGARLSSTEVTTKGGPLVVTLPKFTRDLAMKIRPKGAGRAEPPAGGPSTEVTAPARTPSGPGPATPPARALQPEVPGKDQGR